MELFLKNIAIWTCGILSCYQPISHLCASAASYDQIAYEQMDTLALAAGTDKSSAFHNYTHVYSQLFKPYREQALKFLEIGIYKGDSVKFWESYFPKAELHFIDITDERIAYHSPRSHYHFFDQSDRTSLQTFAAQNSLFDVILDDGGHTMEQQITSFEELFPYVKPGGLYIIEDLHTSYWTTYGGSGNVELAQEGTAVGYLKALVDYVNFAGAASECADVNKLTPEMQKQRTALQRHIAAIHFYPSICIIEKSSSNP